MPDEQQAAASPLYDDRSKAPPAYHAIFLLPLSMIAVTVLAGRTPIVVPLAGVAVLLLVWIQFTVLRITVSQQEVRVQYGLFGPRVRAADIARCETVAHDWKAHGGWGIRYGRDGSRAYDMLGDRRRAVRVAYKKGKREHVVLLSSRDPDRLAASIEEARAAAAASMPVASMPVASMPVESVPVVEAPAASPGEGDTAGEVDQREA